LAKAVFELLDGVGAAWPWRCWLVNGASYLMSSFPLLAVTRGWLCRPGAIQRCRAIIVPPTLGGATSSPAEGIVVEIFASRCICKR